MPTLTGIVDDNELQKAISESKSYTDNKVQKLETEIESLKKEILFFKSLLNQLLFED